MNGFVAYIGNLPSDLSSSSLTTYFALCGPIISAEVINYRDENQEKRAYGFISFKNSKNLEKALLFNNKQLGIHIIKVMRAKGTCLQTYVDGIPLGYSKEDILARLNEHFAGKFSPAISYNIQGSHAALMVSFHDEESRQQYISMHGLFSMKHAVIKDTPKILNTNHLPKDRTYRVHLRNIPHGTSPMTLELMFALCGEIEKVYILNKDNSFVTGTIIFNYRSGFETALKFNMNEVHNWPIPIIISNEKYDPKVDFNGGTALIRCYNENWPLKDIEARICKNPGGVRCARCNPTKLKRGEEPFIYANFKDKKDLEALLNLNSINLGGPGPATFRQHYDKNPGNLTRFSSMESINTINGYTDNIRPNPIPLCPTPTPQNIGPTNSVNKCTIAITPEKKLSNSTLSLLFSRLGKVVSITDCGKTQYIELEL